MGTLHYDDEQADTNDWLYGGYGNDTIDGGLGSDTAVFTGLRSAYTITWNGQTATVTLPSGAVATGRVRLVSPQIDAETKLGQVRVLLPVRSDIRAGGFGRGRLGGLHRLSGGSGAVRGGSGPGVPAARVGTRGGQNRPPPGGCVSGGDGGGL